jgi:hypothetical protein
MEEKVRWSLRQFYNGLISCGNSSTKGGIGDMKRIARKLKVLITVCFIFWLAGCAGNPAPSEAIKACIDKKGVPYYFSNCCQTQFICGPEGTTSFE